MASSLPKNFPPTTEPAIASFDHNEIASGVGIEDFFGATTTDDEILTTLIIPSDLIVSKATAGTTAFSERLSKDFDVPFNVSRVINGTGYVSIETGALKSAQGAVFNPVIKIQKISGATTTTLATSSGSITRSDVDTGRFYGDVGYRRELISFDIANEAFKADDILRVNVGIWGNSKAGPESQTYCFGHDPTDRPDIQSLNEAGSEKRAIIGISGSTILKIAVPFRILS